MMGESMYLSRGWSTAAAPPPAPIPARRQPQPPPHVYTSPDSPRPPPHIWTPPEPRAVPHGYPASHYVPTPVAPPHATPMRHIGTPGNLPLGGGQVSVPPTMEIDPYYAPALIPVKKKGKSKTKKVDGKQPTFLTKLYSILEEPSYRHIIRWDENGEIIIIEKPDELADKILPAVYRQSRFASFSRQLNIYGFMRKVSLRHVEAGIIDPDASTWSHPFLHRESPREDITNFKRRVPPRPSQAKRRSSLAEEIALSPSSSEGSPDPYAHHLLRDHEDVKPPISAGQLPLLFAQPQSPLVDAAPATWEEAETNRRHSIPATPPQPVVFKAIPRAPSAVPSSTIDPQSAPAFASSFPAAMKVTHGHLRTRSVQGEPPSATFWPPGSPLAGNGWTLSDDSSEYSPEPPQPLWLKKSFPLETPPTPTVPAPVVSGLARTLLNSGGGGSFGPSSLPHDFAPGSYVLQTLGHAPPGLMAGEQSTSWSSGDGGGGGYSFSDESLLNPPFVGGMSLPTYRPYLPTTSPKRSAIQAMSKLSMGRRNTLTSPYTSPKTTTSALDTATGPVRGLGRNGSKTADVVAEWTDGGLPSGGLRMDMENPFDHVLRARSD